MLMRYDRNRWIAFAVATGFLIGSLTFFVLHFASQRAVIENFCTAWFIGSFAYLAGMFAGHRFHDADNSAECDCAATISRRYIWNVAVMILYAAFKIGGFYDLIFPMVSLIALACPIAKGPRVFKDTRR